MIYIKIDRLIGILTTLLQNEKVTAPELAEKFEVSRRTINRDIEDLCKAGIPLATVQGTNGGIYIADGYKIDKTLFTNKEMQAVLAGLKSLDSISGNNRYKQLMNKLGIEKDSANGTIYDASGHILIDLASFYKDTLAPKIETIRTAIEENKLITFDYYCHAGESKRKIEPYLIVFQWTSWYVWGFCKKRQAFRMFKLNRLLNLNIIKETFLKRSLPSFKKLMEESFENNIHLIAKFDKSVKWKLIEEYGIDSFKKSENGELLFEFNFTNKDNLLTWVLGFGDKVKIVEPIEIKNEYLQIIDNIRKKY